MSRGLFVTFEGIDGCGKSTQIERFTARCTADTIDHIVTREPGGTLIGENIRSLVMDPRWEAMTQECELLLYCAARAQHVREKIIPSLEKGRVVVSDRFFDATVAYQGYGRGIALESLFSLNRFATGGLEPDITFVFDLPVETALARMRLQGKVPDRLERNAADFHYRVRQGYREIAAKEPQRVVCIDAQRDIESIAESVYEEFTQRRG
jgi:dTMP kinase